MTRLIPCNVMFRGAVFALALTTITQPLATLHAQQASGGTAASDSQNASRRLGITVHGHWILDVKDKDGRIVDHRDFENSLVPSGSTGFALALTGQLVYSSGFEVGVKDTNSSQIYELYNATFPESRCVANGQATLSGVTYRCVNGLGLTYPSCISNQSPSCTVSSGIVLQGSFVATSALAVDTVQTFNYVCTQASIFGSSPVAQQAPVAVDPQTCASSTAAPSGVARSVLGFTGTTVNTLNVAAGQSLLIKVIISFS